jgi:HPt (histidine-containing phosphotransfer) domain-containing protein
MKWESSGLILKPGISLTLLDNVRSLKKVNWKFWRIKKVSREEIMTEALQQLLRDFEEKMTVIFQQLAKESEDLKNEVRELESTCEMLRAEKTTLIAKNMKLKYDILQAGDTLRDTLRNIVMEANEPAPEANNADQ